MKPTGLAGRVAELHDTVERLEALYGIDHIRAATAQAGQGDWDEFTQEIADMNRSCARQAALRLVEDEPT
jgi:hypothetical protein